MSQQHDRCHVGQDTATVRLFVSDWTRQDLLVTPNAGYSADQVKAMIEKGEVTLVGNELIGGIGPDGVNVIGMVTERPEQKTGSSGLRVENPCGCAREPTEAESDQSFAQTLISWSRHYAQRLNPDLDWSHRFLVFANEVLDRGDNWNSQAGIECLTEEALHLEQRGRKGEALPCLQRAFQIAENLRSSGVLDETDFQYVMCHGNYGEVLLEVGRVAEAEPVLVRTLTLLECMNEARRAQGLCELDYTAGVSQLLASARALLAPADVAPAATRLAERPNPRAYLTLEDQAVVQVFWKGEDGDWQQLHREMVEPCEDREFNLVGKIPAGEAGQAKLVIGGKEWPCRWTLTAGWQPPAQG